MTNPEEHSKYGNRIIIFSIFGLGTILGIIGGILAVSFKHDKPEIFSLQDYSQVKSKHCPLCGKRINEKAKFCHKCGKEAIPYSQKSTAENSNQQVTTNLCMLY